MVIGFTAFSGRLFSMQFQPRWSVVAQTASLNYFIALSHKLTYTSSDGGYLRGEIHLVNHRNPLRVKSTFIVIQRTVRGTVYYESWPPQSFICILQVELEVETLLDSIFYISNEVSHENIFT